MLFYVIQIPFRFRLHRVWIATGFRSLDLTLGRFELYQQTYRPAWGLTACRACMSGTRVIIWVWSNTWNTCRRYISLLQTHPLRSLHSSLHGRCVVGLTVYLSVVSHPPLHDALYIYINIYINVCVYSLFSMFLHTAIGDYRQQITSFSIDRFANRIEMPWKCVYCRTCFTLILRSIQISIWCIGLARNRRPVCFWWGRGEGDPKPPDEKIVLYRTTSYSTVYSTKKTLCIGTEILCLCSWQRYLVGTLHFVLHWPAMFLISVLKPSWSTSIQARCTTSVHRCWRELTVCRAVTINIYITLRQMIYTPPTCSCTCDEA